MANVVGIKLVKDRATHKDGKYGCTQEYLVTFDAPGATSLAALTASIAGGAIPEYDSTHPDRPGIKATSIDAELASGSLRHYKVTVEYTEPGDDDENETPTTSPLDEPAEVSYGATGGTEAYFKDKSSTPKLVVNSAGDSFENINERDNDEMTITVNKNQATIDPDTFESLKNTTNTNTVAIDGHAYPAGTLKLRMPTATKARGSYINGSGQIVEVVYYKVTYQFMYRAAGWLDTFLDVGYSYLVSGKSMPIVDASGAPVKKPYPLNGAGGKQATPTTAPAELTFQPYASANHGQLDLS